MANLPHLTIGFRDNLVDHKCLARPWKGSGFIDTAKIPVMGLYALVARLDRDHMWRFTTPIYIISSLPRAPKRSMTYLKATNSTNLASDFIFTNIVETNYDNLSICV